MTDKDPFVTRPTWRTEAATITRAAASQLRTLSTTGPQVLEAVAANPAQHPFRALLLLVWTLGVLLDAGTTVLMMSSGLFEEANPTAAAGMASVGTEVYVVWASLVCVVLAVVNVGVCRGIFAAAAAATLATIGVSKLATGISNAVLWVSVTSTLP